LVVLVMSTRVGPWQPDSLTEACCPRLHSRTADEGQTVPQTLIRVSLGEPWLAVPARHDAARFTPGTHRYREAAVT